MKKIHVLNLIVMISLSGCATFDKRNFETGYAYLHPVPVVMPVKVETLRMYDTDSKTFKEIPVATLSKSQIRNLLTNSSSNMTIQKKDTSGNFKYIPLGFNIQKGEYKITYDFTNSFNQEFELREGVTTTGEFGVGVRLIAEVVTKSNSVDLNGLIPLLINAKNNKLSGSIKYNTYGIRHPKINAVSPPNLNLSEESIQKAFEAIATSKVLIDLDETILEPNLLGYIEK